MEIIMSRIAQVPGTNDGQKTTAVLMTQILPIGVIISRKNLHRGRTLFTARSPTTTKLVQATGRKRLALFRGSRRHIRVRLFPLVKIDGSRSAKAIELLMRNGKTQGHSKRTIANTCLAINVQNPI